MSDGFSLNLSETSLVGINVDREEVDKWATFLECQAKALPTNYLSFILGGDHHERSFWVPLIKKLRAETDSW